MSFSSVASVSLLCSLHGVLCLLCLLRDACCISRSSGHFGAKVLDGHSGVEAEDVRIASACTSIGSLTSTEVVP